MKTHLLSFAIVFAGMAQLVSAQSIIGPFYTTALDRPKSEATGQANLPVGDILGSEVRIRIQGDTALVTGWFVRGGVREPHRSLWVMRGNNWLLVSETARRTARTVEGKR